MKLIRQILTLFSSLGLLPLAVPSRSDAETADLGIMAYLYDEIVARVEPGLRPKPEAFGRFWIWPRWTFRKRNV